MSYCRWSSDDFKSDIYAYADVHGGYTTHVAANRIIGDCPAGPDWSRVGKPGWADEAFAAEQARSKFLDSCERQSIDHPDAGKTFNDPDLESFLARMEQLKAEGFYVPAYVFETIREEMAEGGAA